MENNNTFVHFVINNKSIIIQIEKTLSKYEVIKLKYALTNAQKQLNKDLETNIILILDAFFVTTKYSIIKPLEIRI